MNERNNTGIVTIALIAANILMYAISAYKSRNIMNINIRTLVDLGGNYAPQVQDGEYWRLLSSAFLHGGLQHILLNMYGLYAFGFSLERIAGPYKYLAIYIMSALGGSILSYFMHRNENFISIGASGAVFGLLGATLALALIYKDRIGNGYISNLVFIIALNIMIGISPGSKIDNYGHIGGLIVGFLMSLLLLRRF